MIEAPIRKYECRQIWLPDYAKMMAGLIIRGHACSEHCSECLCHSSKKNDVIFPRYRYK